MTIFREIKAEVDNKMFILVVSNVGDFDKSLVMRNIY